jgi:hypothetical protein
MTAFGNSFSRLSRAVLRTLLLLGALMTTGFADPNDLIQSDSKSSTAKSLRVARDCYEPEPIFECPPSRLETVPGDLNWPTAVIIAFVTAVIGYLLGQQSVPRPPARSLVRITIINVAAASIAQATTFGQSYAVLALEGQRDAIRNALKGIGVSD